MGKQTALRTVYADRTDLSAHGWGRVFYAVSQYWALYGSIFTVKVLLSRKMTCGSRIECPGGTYYVEGTQSGLHGSQVSVRITFDVTVNYAMLMEDIDCNGDLL